MSEGASKPMASMPAPPSQEIFKLAKLQADLEKKTSTKKSSEADEILLLLLKLSPQALGLTEVSSVNREPKNLISALCLEAQRKIRTREKWQTVLPSEIVDQLSSHKAQLERVLQNQAYVLAWLKFQMHLTSEAQALLSQVFESEYQRVMQLARNDGDGMGQAEDIATALQSLKDPQSGQEISAKLKKMKLHLSKLPDLRIMT